MGDNGAWPGIKESTGYFGFQKEEAMKQERYGEMSGYEIVAMKIIVQAVVDYRTALRALSKNNQDQLAKAKMAEIKCFFRSQWFKMLTDLNGESLIERVEKEWNRKERAKKL